MIAIFPVIKQTLLITLFVMSMMLIIEYLNVMTRGLWSKGIKRSKFQQVILGSSLGVIPGCLGAYTAVSIYIHDIIGTGGLVATMIATSGDEAFAMFSLFPQKALLLNLIIFIIAVVSGIVVNRFFKKNLLGKTHANHMHIHQVDECACFDLRTSWYQIKHMRPTRALMLVSILFFVMFIYMDQLLSGGSIFHLLHMGEGASKDADPLWIKITFIIVISLSTLVILIVNDHFLEKHLWGHIIKKHFSKIFLWTFFALVAIAFLMKYFDLHQLIHQNIILVLIAAVLIGIIPESGPHLIFVLLFASGSLPFSILLASSIVQDGHGSLPLLAESRRAFIIVKLLNVAVGLLVGLAGLALGI
jgi:hypothetical protein